MNFLMPHLKDLHLSVFFLFSFLFLPFPIAADEVNYSYDGAGRLVRVEKDTDRVLYQYDEVGNLISIMRDTGTSQTLPPVLQGIDPDIFLIGANYSTVIITGQNLLTTSSVTSDSPNVAIKYIAAIDTKILAAISIGSGASPGQSSITVTTSYGSASMPVNLYKVNVIPQEMSLLATSTASISVGLTPSAPKSVNVAINNKNPDIVDTQSSITIPAGGNVNLSISALKEGTANVEIKETTSVVAETTIFVIKDTISTTAAPVCISPSSITGNIVVNASPVTIAWPLSVSFLSDSLPVSVNWLNVPGAITVSAQVCVRIGN